MSNRADTNSIVKNIEKLGKIDPVLFACTILLNGMGLVSINSVAQVTGNSAMMTKQALGSALGIVLMAALSLIDTKKITRYWKILYAVTIIALLCVLFFGVSGGGARRWIAIGGLTFQPSELAKILLILFYSEFIINLERKLNRTLVFALSTLLILPPFFLILKEPDLSTSIMIFLIFCVIIFVAGLDRKIIAGITAAAIPFALIIIYMTVIGAASFLGDYQRQRILAWLHPEDYATSTAYQTMNSMTAIGSGQLIGKGLHVEGADTLLGTGFISESQTDFIFAVIGEQLGFLGCCIMIFLITMVTVRCCLIASESRSLHDRIIASGMAAWIGFQSYLNIGVATGLLPNTGIPLPFVSYGLTSLICLYGGLGFVQNVHIKNHSADNDADAR
ncbi:MAG: rod shape-determining protein RodA [Lachnospiraceae bacterium]|nr:rod shape-determining protein RodA [Lachnospiraceae bacterium]